MKLQTLNIGKVLNKNQQQSIIGGSDCNSIYRCCSNDGDCENPYGDSDPSGQYSVCREGICGIA